VRPPVAAVLVIVALAGGAAAGVAAGAAGAAGAAKPRCGRTCVLRAGPWRVRRAGRGAGLAAAPGTTPATTTATTPVPTTTTADPPPQTLPPATTTAPPPPPPGFHRTGVALTEFTVVLAHPRLAPGVVELNGINDGMDDHDLTVATAGGTVLGQTPVIAPGGQAQLNLRLAPGTYKIFCSLYGGAHDAAGMHATLTVG
jgi:hypothetical protein